ncbi:MAG: choline/carnitine O-acyltransferase [Desulfuromonadales bacterium]
MESLELDLTGPGTRGPALRILHAVLSIVGFRKFQQGLSEDRLEGFLRRCDLRQLGQCAPAISATVNLVDDPREISPIERAATLLLAARQLYSDIRSGALTPDRYRGQALEMGQYPNLFATSIVWEGWRPRIFKSTDTVHVNLAIGRRLYSLDVGELEAELSIDALREALSELAERARRSPLPADEPSIGLLTCAKTGTQRKAFRLLQKESKNRQALQSLRHSLFTLCLELEHLPETDAEAAHMAHSENLCNRWHHSSLQLVVFGNAKASAIFKFDACIDGNTMMRGAAEIQKRAARFALRTPAHLPLSGCPVSTELRCRIDKSLVQRARKDVQSILDNQKATFEIRNIGRLFFETRNVDPVPAFILALHMTIAHLTGKTARIEQQLALSKYRCMGLTTAVVTTPEMAGFTKYAAGNDVQPDKARALMEAAIDSQKQACRKARSHLPFSQLIPLFTTSLEGVKKIYVGVIVVACKLLGVKWFSEVIVSHPSIFPEASMLGRPGVRLPYLDYFGLHYRMLDESIIVTMMPSLKWDIPNAEVIAVLERNLHRLKEIIGNEN